MTTDLQVELARRLRAAREAASLTQAELAAQLALSVRSLQDYEARRATPLPTRRRRILEFIRTQEAA